MPTDTDDLNATTGEETTTATTGTEGAEGAAAEKTTSVASPEAGKTEDKGTDGKGADGKPAKTTIATGAEGDDEKAKAAAEKADADKAAARDAEIKAFRESLAKHASAGDKKAYDKELKRLERLGIEKPEQLYGHYRELEAKTSGAGLIKVPGKDAKPEDVAEFHKAIGVPEKPEELIAAIKLENGAVIGEADKPIVDMFGNAMHKAGATPAVMNAAVNAYYAHLAKLEADQADADDDTRRENTAKLKEEFGGHFRREMGAIKTLFDGAPGGADEKNAGSLYSRVMTARTQDGKMLGDDFDFLMLLRGWRQDIRPFATVTEDGAGTARSAEARLAEIRALRKTDMKKYLSADVQAEELRLISAIEAGKAHAGA